jgi:hypothetical protein
MISLQASISENLTFINLMIPHRSDGYD